MMDFVARDGFGGVHITRHAHKRIKERIPGMKSARRRVETVIKAFTEGVRYCNGTGSQRARLRRYFQAHPEDSEEDIVLYGGMIYVFQGANLVTVLFDVPKSAQKKKYARAKLSRDVEYFLKMDVA